MFFGLEAFTGAEGPYAPCKKVELLVDFVPTNKIGPEHDMISMVLVDSL